MNLYCETIFNYYMYKNKKILCQIKVKSSKIKSTCRSLTPEQWNIFDKKMEELIEKTVDWNKENSQRFNINPFIEVKVQKSKLSLKHFNICLGALGVSNKVEERVAEANFILECVFNFHPEKPFKVARDSQEYIPQIECSPEGKIGSTLSYEPYTPSKKEYRADNIENKKTSDTDLLEISEDTYSPKPLFETNEADLLINDTIPKYTPAPIKTNIKKNVREAEDVIKSSQKYKSSKSNLDKIIENEYIPKSEQFAIIDAPVYIPTPIDETTLEQNVFKTDNNVRKYKKRSKTIDEYPLQLYENNRDLYKPLNENLDFQEIPSIFKRKMLIKRSKTIDEIPAAFAIYDEKVKLNEKTFEKDVNSYEKLKLIDKSNKMSQENKKISNENISIIKNKTKSFSSSNKDDVLLDHVKSKKPLKKPDEKIELKESTTQERIKEDNIANDFTSLRRSERSSSKPIRFIEEQPNLLKKLKISPKNRELFGTDDEDDDESLDNKNATKINDNIHKMKTSVFKTPTNEKYPKTDNSSSSSSAKKKRKREKSNECEQEKRDINKWLSKKKYSSSRSRSKSPMPSLPPIELSSVEELEFLRNRTRLEQKENKIVQINKSKMYTSSPEEVGIM